MRKKRRLLGKVLKDEGFITEEQLEEALEKQKKEGVKLGEALLDLGYINEEIFSEALGKQLDMVKVNLNEEKPEKKVLDLLEEEFIREHQVLPMDKEDDVLKVVMADPLNVFAIDEITHRTGLEVESVVCNRKQLKGLINEIYGQARSMDEVLNDIENEKAAEGVEEVEEETEKDLSEVQQMAVQAPIVKLVNSIILEGIERRASDIHVEPGKKKVRIRYRIDGILVKKGFLPKGTKMAVISRMKIMAGLDIAERRIPQDGRISVKVKGRNVDMRCSTLPTIHGEKVVLRVIDPEAVVVELEKLGMLPGTLDRFLDIIHKPHGMILITGPTSSGKTSTLYAALRRINNMEDNIMTIEDPVEFPVQGINQVQINPKAGLTFASGLRAFLRQDPDKVMVGEIRDLETAEIAIHAALTGHLVFSTLHTNDAAGVVIRLTNMGIEPFLVTSAVLAAGAQRLVREICSECKEKIEPPKDVLESLDFSRYEDDDQVEEIEFYKGKGCIECNGTGYRGRTGIFELFTLNSAVKDAILSDKSVDEIRKIAIDTGSLKPLRRDGIIKATRGITTLEEVLRVTQEEEHEK